MSNSENAANLEMDIRELIAEIIEENPSAVKNDAHFVKDLGMDSMMALEILASIEKRYRIVISEEELPKFVNLNETIKVVEEILNSK